MLNARTMHYELENEFDNEYEGEFENEYEGEYEGEFENEYEGEFESEFENEYEGEYESEYESEAFIKEVRRLARKLAPILKRIAPIAEKTVGAVVDGELENEFENEYEGEFENEYENEFENEYEGEFENEYEGEFENEYEYEAALAEAFAGMASQVQSEAEAEAYTGALAATTLPLTSTALQQVSPHLIKGVATLTQTLRKSPQTRPLVKTLPTILRNVSQILERLIAQGKQITPTIASRVIAKETRKVLSNPMVSAQTLLSSQTATTVTRGERPASRQRRQPISRASR